ncbi:hypothetical protein BV133_815 [Blastochloris viridis]|uniref:Uncharacterized protein n=1 Tax=Blastochloris viridis TaxID=1079 RepID=A0A182CZA5_BLAVI|nr:hypothetical protein BV133_815 [Blastochloris viridis]
MVRRHNKGLKRNRFRSLYKVSQLRVAPIGVFKSAQVGGVGRFDLE